MVDTTSSGTWMRPAGRSSLGWGIEQQMSWVGRCIVSVLRGSVSNGASATQIDRVGGTWAVEAVSSGPQSHRGRGCSHTASSWAHLLLRRSLWLRCREGVKVALTWAASSIRGLTAWLGDRLHRQRGAADCLWKVVGTIKAPQWSSSHRHSHLSWRLTHLDCCCWFMHPSSRRMRTCS